MKKLWLIAFLLFALGTTVIPALAQTTRIKTFTSSDGVFTFAYPGDWQFVGTKPTEATGKNADQTITAVITYPAVTVKGPSNTPVQYLQSAASDMAKYLTNPKVTALKIGEWDAARLDATSPQFGGITSFAVAYPDHLVSMMFLGKVEALQQADDALLAMVGSFVTVSKTTIRDKTAHTTGSSSSGDAQPLTKTFTSGNGVFSMKYPAGWTAIDVDPGTVALRNGDGLVFVGGYPAGDASVAPRDYLGGLLGDATFTDLEINGRPATRIDNSKMLRGGGGLLINFDGTYAYFNWIGTPEQIRNADATMMAMAQTFELNDEAAANTAPAESLTTTPTATGALTQSYVADDESYSFNYPDTWQIAPSKDRVNFTVADQSMQGVVEYQISDQPARQLVVNLLKKAGISVTPTSYEHKGRTIITAAAGDGTLSVEMYGVDFDQNHVLVVTFLGDAPTIKQAQDQIAAVVESFRDDARAPLFAFALSGEIAPDSVLTEHYSADGTFTFRYPAGWTFETVGGAAELDFESQDKTVNGRLSYGQFGKKAAEYIAGKAAQFGLPATIVRTFVLNGRTAAEITVPDSGGAFAGRYIAVDFEDGNILYIGAAGLMRAFDKGNPLLFGLMASFKPDGVAETLPTSTPRGLLSHGAATLTPTCTVFTSAATNLRGGPGMTFAKAGTLAADTPGSVTGQATGGDGKLWYQLDSGNWVRSDLVRSSGDCDSLPTITP